MTPICGTQTGLPTCSTGMINNPNYLRRLDRIFVHDPIYLITTCTFYRAPLLNNPVAHQLLKEEWLRAAGRHGWAVGFYVVMPDHVHLFVSPVNDKSDQLSAFVAKWKQWTAKRLLPQTGLRNLWQPRFHDHLLRSEESYQEKRQYMYLNPIRAGLVQSGQAWPYQGELMPL